MWGIFGKPRCPIDDEMRVWVDARFRWLQDQFGIEAPYHARVILPTPEFFPDPHNGKLEDVHKMLVRVAGYMKVDPNRFNLYLFESADRISLDGMRQQHTSGAAGLYHMGQSDDPTAPASRSTIGIESKRLGDPMSLVATLAHEIGHELLLGQKRISRDEPDHEPLTDLITVFLGLGIFTANATIEDGAWTRGSWAGWKTSRHGYLDQRTLGYALAQFARVRGEHHPAWMKYVRADVRSPMRESLRFLLKTT